MKYPHLEFNKVLLVSISLFVATFAVYFNIFKPSVKADYSAFGSVSSRTQNHTQKSPVAKDVPVAKEAYECPETSYVNCMPTVYPEKPDARCSEDFLDWAAENCTGFQGAAY